MGNAHSKWSATGNCATMFSERCQWRPVSNPRAWGAAERERREGWQRCRDERARLQQQRTPRNGGELRGPAVAELREWRRLWASAISHAPHFIRLRAYAHAEPRPRVLRDVTRSAPAAPGRARQDRPIPSNHVKPGKPPLDRKKSRHVAPGRAGSWRVAS
jgi:hypothetical protein